MSDIVERLQEERLVYAHRPSLTVVLDDAQIEITRLRSLLKEAAMALAAVMEDDNVPYDESCANHEWGRSVLSKIKGDA